MSMKLREMTAGEFGASMIRLGDNADFNNLRGAWIVERSSIIEDAKKSRKPEDIAVLDGFDRAIKVFERGLRLAGVNERPDPAKEISKQLAEAGHD